MRRSYCNSIRGGRTRLAPPQATVPAYIETSFVPPRAGLSERAVVTRMASDMREAAYREGGMTREGLKLLGYTNRQIDDHADAARIRADQLAAAS